MSDTPDISRTPAERILSLYQTHAAVWSRLRGKELRVEADAAAQVIDVQVDMEAFHEYFSFQQDAQGSESETSQAAPWQQCSVM